MDLRSKDEEQAIKYLLGELSEAETAQVEERSFDDAQFSELLSDVENDLVDEYVRKELSFGARARFERYFLISARRIEKVEVATALLEMERATLSTSTLSTATHSIDKSAPHPWWRRLAAPLFALRPAPAYSFVAAAILFLLAGVLLLSEISELRKEIARLQAEQGADQQQSMELEQQAGNARRQSEELKAEKAELEQELANVKQQLEASKAGQPAAPTLLSFVLSPGYRSAEGPKKLVIPRDVRSIRLQLNLNPGDEYPAYKVDLHTASGDRVRSWSMLKARPSGGERAVFVELSARLMDATQYELVLSGVTDQGRLENLGYYYFSLEKN